MTLDFGNGGASGWGGGLRRAQQNIEDVKDEFGAQSHPRLTPRGGQIQCDHASILGAAGKEGRHRYLIDSGRSRLHGRIEVTGQRQPEGLQELVMDRVHKRDAFGRQAVGVADIVLAGSRLGRWLWCHGRSFVTRGS